MADANAKAGMVQWRHAATELPKIRARELRELSEERGTRQAIGLEPILPATPRSKNQALSPMPLSTAITSALGTLSRGSESIEAVLNMNAEENRFTRALQDLQRLAEHQNIRTFQ